MWIWNRNDTNDVQKLQLIYNFWHYQSGWLNFCVTSFLYHHHIWCFHFNCGSSNTSASISVDPCRFNPLLFFSIPFHSLIFHIFLHLISPSYLGLLSGLFPFSFFCRSLLDNLVSSILMMYLNHCNVFLSILPPMSPPLVFF